MDITYFHWHINSPHSILRSFRPMIDNLKEEHSVSEYYMPYTGALPWNIIRNIYFVYKHRNKRGVNHITGDVHYCIMGLIGCKSVLTIHDDYAIRKARRGIFDKIYKWLLWLYIPIKLADRVICISDSTKIKIDKLVNNNKTKVVANHSVDSAFKYVPKLFNSICPVILQIGTSSHKNLETTLKALSGINCSLRVIKEMSLEQHALAKSLGINYSNAFNLSDDEILEEYINSDIVVFPSLYEGFGLPIVEAQATGRVVLTSNVPPMNEVAGEGAMLLNDPLDEHEYRKSILSIIEDGQMRERIIEDGLNNIQRYTVKVASTKYLSIYKSLLDSNEE